VREPDRRTRALAHRRDADLAAPLEDPHVTPELHFIVNVTMAVLAALVGGLIAHRLRQSVIVGYLLAGIALGPFTPGFIGNREQIAALAEIGVIFLMFALGIEFSLRELTHIRGVAFGGTLLQVALLIGIGCGTGLLLGWPLAQGLFFGGIIAISSTMVILKTLLDRGEVASHHGRILLAMLIVQDLVVVLLIVLLPGLTAASGPHPAATLLLTLLKALAFIAATIVLGVRVVPRVMARVERLRSPELFLLTAVTLALGIATASALLGLSPALGAFLGGLLLTETEFEHRVIAEVVPMRNLFATLFFVSIGMLIDPAFVVAHLPEVLGLTLLIVVAKAVATLLAVLPFRLGRRTVLFTSLGMIQIGEFSYVLAGTGTAVGAITGELGRLLLAASVLTILLTPPAFWVAPRLDALWARVSGPAHDAAARATLEVPETTWREHVIVVGYGRVGRYVATGLREVGASVVVIEEDLHVAQSLRAAGLPVIFGNAVYQSVLAAAHPEHAAALISCLPDAGATYAVVRMARGANAGLPIAARIAREADVGELMQLGVRVVLPETAGAQALLAICRDFLDVPVSADQPPLLGADSA
jgi:CPA2 family monovalent cation:H+ antiporter-2